MAKAAVVFNGIQLSFLLIDTAFAWAKQNNGSLLAIFLKAKHETKEGYFFPSDLDAAEDLASNKDAETGNSKVIDTNIRILEHQATFENIDLKTLLLTNPSEKEMLAQFTDCERIFIHENINYDGILAVESINLKKLMKRPPIPIEIVRANK